MEAFEALYDRYHRNLLAFCRHMLGSREEAEDALQHTFLAAYRHLRAGDEIDRPKPWLYTIARNRCLSMLRERHPDAALDDGAPATEGLVAEVERRADLQALLRDLQRLAPDQRAALVLFELGDLSHEEIAESIGVRRDKVKALVFQAREALMGWRAARETPCEEVREQLATLTGSALRRGSLRRHVEQCSGCAEYEADVRGQRAALAIVLPVVPAAGLKATVLGSLLGGSGAAAAVTGGGFAGLGAKVLIATAIVGGAGATGYVAIEDHREPTAGRATEVAAAPPGASRAVPSRPVALPEKAGTERPAAPRKESPRKESPRKRSVDPRQPKRSSGREKDDSERPVERHTGQPRSSSRDQGAPPDKAKGRAKKPASPRRAKHDRPDRAKKPAKRGSPRRAKGPGSSRPKGSDGRKPRGAPRHAKEPVAPKPSEPAKRPPKPKPAPEDPAATPVPVTPPGKSGK